MSFDETKFEPTLLENKDYQYIRLSIDSLSDTDKNFIRKNLLEISSGRGSELNLVSEATELVEYLAGLDINKRNGAIAEFLLICILREKGFSQEYCFKNLEENSAKKGFDGLVIKENQFWLVESKSSQINHGNSHRNTIYRAYSGLKKQLSGANKKINNPWHNAYNHARSAMSNKGLQKILASQSNSYTEKNFSTIDEHNVVIGSTVIPDNMINKRVIATISDIDSSIESIDNYIKNHESKDELIGLLYEIGQTDNNFDYIINESKKYKKSLHFLYRPRFIEQYAKELFENLPETTNQSQTLDYLIEELKEIVHPRFKLIKYLEKGIIYLHGRIPSNIRNYLLKYVREDMGVRHFIANSVVLAGMNLPIDSLFYISGFSNLNDLYNLIGRVNRLNEIFGNGGSIERILIPIYFTEMKRYP